MRKEDKGTIIEQIAATVKEYSHFYLIDITAMNAAATSALRRECFKSDIKLMLIKIHCFTKHWKVWKKIILRFMVA